MNADDRTGLRDLLANNRTVEPVGSDVPVPSRFLHVAAAIGCTLVCALLAVRLATSAT